MAEDKPGLSDILWENKIVLASHGGECCGIYCIKNFELTPESWCAEKKLFPNSSSYPVERAEKRLERVILGAERGRPRGILEIVLIESELDEGWDKVLERLQFRLVNQMENANTGNVCYVYHRNSGAPGVEKIKL